MINNKYSREDKNGKFIVEEFIGEKPDKLIICVHGFGVDRGDGGGMFFDIANNQDDAVVTVLVDLNSPDEAAGMLKVNNFSDQAVRLQLVISEFTAKYPGLELNLIAHSMGCGLLAKNKIKADRVIFLAPASGDLESNLKPRLLAREGSFEDVENKRLIAKRSDGSTTIIPNSFFEELKNESWPDRYEEYLKVQNPLKLIVAGEDEILKETTKNVTKLNFSSIDIIKDADHNFMGTSRAEMLDMVRSLLSI
jgi:hypothetical protein